AIALLAGPASSAQDHCDAGARLHALFDLAWEQDLRDDPRLATHLGDARFNARWADLSAAAFAQRDRRYRDWIARADRIPEQDLSAQDRLNRELFKLMLQDRIDRYRFRAHLRAIDQLNYSGSVLTASE